MWFISPLRDMLIDEKWVSIFDLYGALVRCPEHYVRPRRPTFDTDIQIVGNTFFGLIYGKGVSYFDIHVSSSLNPSDDIFLRPSLTHDKLFRDYIYSLPDDDDLSSCISFGSSSLVTIDNDQGIICAIVYDNDPSEQFSNFAVLTFFRVHGDSYQGDLIHEPEPEQEDGKEPVLPSHWNNIFRHEDDKDRKHVNFFRADYITGTCMPIDTYKQVTHGDVYASLIA